MESFDSNPIPNTSVQLPNAAGPQPKSSFSKKLPLLLLLLVLIVLALIAVFYAITVSFESPKDEKDALRTLFTSVGNNDDFNNISQLEQLKAATSSIEGKIRYDLYQFPLLVSGARGEAYALLRKIAADENNIPKYRGFAVQLMADYFLFFGRNPEVAHNFIFVEEPYQTLGNETNISVSIRKIYEYSLSFAPSPISDYRIALSYLTQLDDPKTSKAQRDEFLTIAEKYYTEGNSSLKEYQKWMEDFWWGYSGYAEWLQAATLGRLGQYESDPIKISEANTKFAAAVSDLKLAKQTSSIQVQLSWAEFEYASFLQRNHNQNKQKEIAELLNEIINLPGSQYSLARYLENLPLANQDVLTVKNSIAEIKLLADVEPNFKQYLINFGWKF